MKEKERLVIISNEKIYQSEENFYCENIEMKSIPENLLQDFHTTLISRKTNIKRHRQIKLNKIKLSSNIFSYLINIFEFLNNKRTTFLIISITPYTFFAYILLFFFKKRTFVYMRSNGFEEYKLILGYFGPLLYNIMFSFVSYKSNLISCRYHLLHGKTGKVVSPSQLNEKWFVDRKNPDLTEIKLLYVGRIKVEKGVFSLLKILKDLNNNVKLTLVHSNSNYTNTINQKNVQFVHFTNNHELLLNIYDDHNIFVLPSYTEGHPQVLDESLSRLRPVIIFDEISHVIENRKGIYISQRNKSSFLKTINFIKHNYSSIQKEMMKNILPTKKNFQKEMSDILTEDKNKIS